MKLKNLFFAAAGLLLFSACSNEDTPEGSGSTEVTGSGYIAVKINLPTTPSTRAANDDFDDGTAEEYKVSDGALILFAGANEAVATFKAAYNIGSISEDVDDDDDNITTSFIKTQKVNDITISAGENIYALVMLNYTDVVDIQGTSLKIGSENFTGTFTDLLGKTTDKAFYKTTDGKENYFFMTNAPICNTPGGNSVTAPAAANVTTLALLQSKDGKGPLYATEDEAKANVAASIFVERATAKATLSLANNAKDASFGSEAAPFSIASAEWSISNTEATSYIVRNSGDLSYIGYASSNLTPTNYRFVGHTQLGTTLLQPVVPFYRTYWCIDPSYNADKTYDGSTSFVGTDKALYCHENTFGVAFQNYKNTTRAVLKVTLKDKDGKTASFYTVNGNEKTIYTTESDATSFGNKWIIETPVITTAFTEALNDKTQTVDIEGYVKVTYQRNATTGVLEAKTLAIEVPDTEIGTDKKFSKAPELTDADKTRLLTMANEYYRINMYENGACYYDLRFKHFAGEGDNDLAPWSSTVSVNTTADAYKNNAADYLGRYGMVRNNWYDVSVTDIKQLGSPVIPDADVVKSDDNKEIEKYISFTVNVLSWAKRTQNVEF